MTELLDVVIVGAGLSGLNAACHLRAKLPHLRFAVLEARDAIGGTWDLFRYPGIRSDSDMQTLGFAERPWRDAAAIADGDAILDYMHATVAEERLEPFLRFGQRVEHAAWSSASNRWTLRVRDVHTENERVAELDCRFLWVCTGYYRYDQGYTPDFPGRERFAGTLVHPQHWPAELDLTGKHVVVIGSGATAVTLVPALAERAAHVTMLQRSPSYVLSLPRVDPIATWLAAHLPERSAYTLTRWKNVLRAMLFYELSRRFPDRARRLLIRGVRHALGPDFDVATHFHPRYDPWDQRVCFVPDGDLFAALRSGRASVVTDTIETFTERGLALGSGRELEAEVIVTATGLQVQLFGGAGVTVDGEAIQPATKVLYKGMMLDGVPNLAVSIGYTNASWTLKCELISRYVCRLLRHMERHGYARCTPQLPHEGVVGDEPLVDLSSGYIQRAGDVLPRQGRRAPWRLYQNFVLDSLALRLGRVDDAAMRFERA